MAEENTVIQAFRNLGDARTPQDVYRRRKQAMDVFFRLGSPVLIKKIYTIEDVENGVAQKSPNWTYAGQTRHNDPFSHGQGFCSIETSDDEWISPSGELIVADNSPGPNYTLAPKYRGFGPGNLTYVVEPDAPLDTFKLTPTGALIKTQDATGQAPWFPILHDNDLLINVTLDQRGNISSTQERYQLKVVTPISFRGNNRKGWAEGDSVTGQRQGIGGNRFLVNQTFQMNPVPINDALYEVEIDR